MTRSHTSHGHEMVVGGPLLSVGGQHWSWSAAIIELLRRFYDAGCRDDFHSVRMRTKSGRASAAVIDCRVVVLAERLQYIQATIHCY